MATNLGSSLLSALVGAIPAAVGNVFKPHSDANAQIEQYIQEIYAFSTQPDAIMTAATGIATVPNRPLQATLAAIAIKQAANNPDRVIALAAGLHNYMVSQQQTILTGVLNSLSGTVTVGA